MSVPVSPADTTVLQHIGNIVHEGARLELAFALLASALLGQDQPVGLYLFGRENASRLLATIRDTLQITDDCEAKDAVSDWLGRAAAAWDERNLIAHATLGRSDDGSLHWIRLRRKLSGPRFTETPVDVASMEALIVLMKTLSQEFDEDVTRLVIRDLPYTGPALGHGPAPAS